MMEKGSRKTAPPDTARVKVHKYNLQMGSNMHAQVLNPAVVNSLLLQTSDNMIKTSIYIFI